MLLLALAASGALAGPLPAFPDATAPSSATLLAGGAVLDFASPGGGRLAPALDARVAAVLDEGARARAHVRVGSLGLGTVAGLSYRADTEEVTAALTASVWGWGRSGLGSLDGVIGVGLSTLGPDEQRSDEVVRFDAHLGLVYPSGLAAEESRFLWTVLRPGLGMAPPLRLSVSASPKGQAWETGLALDGSAPFGPALRWENSLALRDAWSAHATLGATPIPGNSDPTSEDEKLLEIDTLSADLGATWRW